MCPTTRIGRALPRGSPEATQEVYPESRRRDSLNPAAGLGHGVLEQAGNTQIALLVAGWRLALDKGAQELETLLRPLPGVGRGHGQGGHTAHRSLV